MKSLLLLLTLGTVGCHTLGIDTRSDEEIRKANAEEARHQQRRAELDRLQQQEYQRRLAWEAHYDQLCLAPQTVAQQNWCIERQRQKDRAYAEHQQQRQWDHEQRLQEERLQFSREQERRAAIREAFRPAPPKPTINCRTTPDYAGGSRTTCD